MKNPVLRLTEARIETEMKTDQVRQQLQDKDLEIENEEKKLIAQREENAKLKIKLEQLRSQLQMLKQTNPSGGGGGQQFYGGGSNFQQNSFFQNNIETGAFGAAQSTQKYGVI